MDNKKTWWQRSYFRWILFAFNLCIFLILAFAINYYKKPIDNALNLPSEAIDMFIVLVFSCPVFAVVLVICSWLVPTFEKVFLNALLSTKDGTKITEEALKTVFDNHKLINALDTILPKHQKDEEYGFDIIPYLLTNINKRRERFLSSARTFFVVTVSLGVLFTGTLLYLGYIVVNDDAAGVGKKLNEVSTYAKRIDELSAQLNSREILKYKTIKSFGSNFLDDLQGRGQQLFMMANNFDLKDFNLKDKDLLEKRSASITSHLNYPATFDVLSAQKELIALDKWLVLSESSSEAVRQYKQLLGEMIPAVEKILKMQEEDLQKIGSLPVDLNALVTQIKSEKTNETTSRIVAEIVRRIFLGLVVVTFLLAILRYAASLYRESYRQALLADCQELAVRRFYVAFKCTSGNDEQRKSVIQNFITETNAIKPEDAPSEAKDGINLPDKWVTGLFDLFKKSLDIVEKKIEK